MAEKGTYLKLVQLNIWQGKLLKNAIEFLKSQDADAVCLQEVFSSERAIPTLDMVSTLESLQDQLDYPYVFFAPTFTYDILGSKVAFGNAILSKTPFKSKRVVFTNQQFHHVKNWDEHPPNTRNALIVELELGSKGIFTLVNHHAYWEPTPLGSEKSTTAMKRLVEEIRNVSTPLIVAGDLNVSYKSPTMRVFDGWLESLTEKNQIADTLTQFGKVRNVPCDHILISNEIKPSSFTVSNALVSDHAPLILEFDI